MYTNIGDVSHKDGGLCMNAFTWCQNWRFESTGPNERAA